MKPNTRHGLSINIGHYYYPFHFLSYLQNVGRLHHLYVYVRDKILKNVVRTKCYVSLLITLDGISMCESNFSFVLLSQRKGKVILIILCLHQEFKDFST